MKKTILTIAIVLGMAVTSFGQYFTQKDQQGGGLFSRGDLPPQEQYSVTRENDERPLLPQGYALHGDQNALDVPVGSGMALLVGLGAAYLLAKKRRED